MAYPTDDLTTNELDAGTDDPSAARAELLAAVQKIQDMLNNTGTGNSYVLKLTSAGDIPSGVNKEGDLTVGNDLAVTGNVGVGSAPTYLADIRKDISATVGVALRIANSHTVTGAGPSTRLLFGSNTDADRDGAAIDCRNNVSGGNNMSLSFFVRDATNTLQEYLIIPDNGGIYTPNATGGSRGADTINASGFYQDGVNIGTSSFSTRKSAQQTNITGTQIITFETEVFDTNSDFASNRFTPTIAGKYFINANILWSSVTSGDTLSIYIYKNGTVYRQSYRDADAGVFIHTHISGIVDMNGSTDYIEIYAQNSDRDTSNINANAQHTYFEGYLV